MNNQEFLEFVGTGLTSRDKEEIKLSGYGTVYTSEVYRNRVKNMVRKVAPQYSRNILESLIDNGVVVPISLSKNLFNYLRRRKEITNERNLGFYDGDDKKIYLLWEPLMQDKRKYAITSVLFHEVMHLAAVNNPKAFFNFNKVPLLKYYFYVYSKFFKVPKQHYSAVMKAVAKWVQDALVIREQKRNRTDDKYLVDFVNEFDKYSSLEQKEIDRKQKMVYDAWRSFLDDSESYEDEEELWQYFDNAYLKALRMDPKKEKLGKIAEEIVFPSAVISKLAEHNPNLPYVKKSLRLTV